MLAACLCGVAASSTMLLAVEATMLAACVSWEDSRAANDKLCSVVAPS